MSDKRVTFEFGGLRLIGADGKTMWEHKGQVWYDLPQGGAVWLQGLLIELEAKLNAMGEIVAEGGTTEEKFKKAVERGLMPGKRKV